VKDAGKISETKDIKEQREIFANFCKYASLIKGIKPHHAVNLWSIPPKWKVALAFASDKVIKILGSATYAYYAAA